MVLIRPNCFGIVQIVVDRAKNEPFLAERAWTPVQGFNYFSIMFYYIITITYQKIGNLFCPVIFLDFRIVQCLLQAVSYDGSRYDWGDYLFGKQLWGQFERNA